MQSRKIKKMPIVFPLLILVIALTVYTVLSFSNAKVADEITLGQQHLNNAKYDEAVTVFSKTVSQNPNNNQARLGLAKAHIGTGEYMMAVEMLLPMCYGSSPDTGALQILADLYAATNQPQKNVATLHQIVMKEDTDEAYQNRGEALKVISAQPVLAAVTEDRSFTIRGDKLYGMGNNDMGQLGLKLIEPTESEPDPEQVYDDYVDVQFPNKAKSVACAGKTTYVIDTEGVLWYAGENRWGQASSGQVDYSLQQGWHKIECEGKAAQVCGTQGRVLVMMEDGSLWTAGIANEKELTRMIQFPLVVSVGANEERAVVLTADGNLMVSRQETPDHWTRLKSKVTSVSMQDDGLVWQDRNHNIQSENRIPVPLDWVENPNGSYDTGTMILSVVAQNDISLIVDVDGNCCYVSKSGAPVQIETSQKAVRAYGVGNSAVVEFEDGSAQWFDFETKKLKKM